VTGISGQHVLFPIGTIIGAIINFLAVAVVVYFVFVYPMNKAKERAAAKAGVGTGPEEQGLPTEQELLVQIRDLLEKERA
ncbi:MAG: MscL family protein, partial [Microbacterium sp.]|nr:MscL family protein [Microbacterium sp.]